MTITREAIAGNKLVYIATANKTVKYQNGKSRIVYIGQTERGVKRIAESAAERAPNLLRDHGIKNLTFYAIKCTPIQKVKTWKKLEIALLVTFREMYGEIPKLNKTHEKTPSHSKPDYFTEERLRKIITKYQ